MAGLRTAGSREWASTVLRCRHARLLQPARQLHIPRMQDWLPVLLAAGKGPEQL
jgi:hypothetical protein